MMKPRPQDRPETLARLQPGETGVIVAVEGEPELRTRLLSLGLRPGRRVAVIRRSRFGGPLQVRLGTSDLLIRPQQAANIRLA